MKSWTHCESVAILWFVTSTARHAFLGALCTVYNTLSLSIIVSHLMQQMALDDCTIVIFTDWIVQAFRPGMEVKTSLVSHWWTGTIIVIFRVQISDFFSWSKFQTVMLSAVNEAHKYGVGRLHVHFSSWMMRATVKMKFTLYLPLQVNKMTAITLSVTACQATTKTAWMRSLLAVNDAILIRTASPNLFYR